jgi:hypothetical protein
MVETAAGTTAAAAIKEGAISISLETATGIGISDGSTTIAPIGATVPRALSGIDRLQNPWHLKRRPQLRLL